MATPEEISARAAQIAFGEPVIQNDFRGLIVEVIVEAALGGDWKLCSANWLSWDFQHIDGTRLEIKQSAAQQTWPDARRPSPPAFDIKPRKGHYEGAEWVPEFGRKAHIYIFGYHPYKNPHADHRDPTQWEYYVLQTTCLPSTGRIGLSEVRKRSQRVDWLNLSAAVEAAHLAHKIATIKSP
jgi:hypothetical protein